MTKQPDVYRGDFSTAPIDVKRDTDKSKLSAVVEGRLEAVLAIYGLDPDADGWRSLALRLVQHHRYEDGTAPLNFTTPVDRKERISGPEVGSRYWLAQYATLLASRMGTTKAAAERLSKQAGISARSIQNLVAKYKAGKLRNPRSDLREPFQQMIDEALDEAASRMEIGHEAAVERANSNHKVPR